jgi:hypothetical protein
MGMAAIMPDRLGAWSLTDDTMKRHGVGVGEARCLGKVTYVPALAEEQWSNRESE